MMTAERGEEQQKADRPDPVDLWEQAGGGTPGYDRPRWLDLMRKHWLPEGTEFPLPGDVNWELLKRDEPIKFGTGGQMVPAN